MGWGEVRYRGCGEGGGGVRHSGVEWSIKLVQCQYVLLLPVCV